MAKAAKRHQLENQAGWRTYWAGIGTIGQWFFEDFPLRVKIRTWEIVAFLLTLSSTLSSIYLC